MAAICLSAIFCLPEAFNLFGFPIKFAEADKEVLNECTSAMDEEGKNKNTDKKKLTTKMLKLPETHCKIDVLQQKHFATHNNNNDLPKL